MYWAGSRGRSGRSRPVGVAGGDRVGQGVRDELGAQVIGQGEPDDAAGGDVDDGGQVQPAFPGGDVGDVAAPRWLILAASAVKSRRIASARAAAAGSGIVVFFQRLGARPAIPAWRISRAIRLRECRGPGRAARRGSAARHSSPWTACAPP